VLDCAGDGEATGKLVAGEGDAVGTATGPALEQAAKKRSTSPQRPITTENGIHLAQLRKFARKAGPPGAPATLGVPAKLSNEAVKCRKRDALQQADHNM